VRPEFTLQRTRFLLARGLQWVVSLSVIVAVWAWLLSPHTSGVFLRPPGEVWDRLVQWATNGQLYQMVRPTLIEAVLGLSIGAVLGIAIACLVVLTPPLVGKMVEPTVVAIYAAPKFALIPLIYITLGSGMVPRLIFVVLAVFAVVFVNMVSGLRTIDTNLVTMLRLYGASRWQVTSKLLLRHAMGYVSTALTFCASYALLVAIAAEMLFQTVEGIGGTLNSAGGSFDATGVLAAITVATILAVVIIGLTRALGAKATWVERSSTANR
jgi:NitT/TauT family transport system permease protein